MGWFITTLDIDLCKHMQQARTNLVARSLEP